MATSKGINDDMNHEANHIYKKSYTTPDLIVYGRLTDITKGTETRGQVDLVIGGKDGTEVVSS